MKKKEIEKKIAKLDQELCKLSEALNDLKDEKEEPKFEAGKWYKSSLNKDELIFMTEVFSKRNFSSYGFGVSMRNDGHGWFDNERRHLNDGETMMQATKEEVETALIAEAEKRYTNKCKVESLYDSNIERVIDFKKLGWTNLSETIFGAGDYDLFNDGRWAEIIKEGPKFEVGNWYYTENGGLWFFEGGDLFTQTSHGFGYSGKWFDLDARQSTYTREATKKEVEKALIVEAKKRGFSESMSEEVECLVDGMIWRTKTPFEYHKGRLDLGATCIFLNGKWAKIPKKKNELNGQKVTRIKHTGTGLKSTSIGCVTLENEAAISHIAYLKEHGITSINHPELGQIEVKDLEELIK